MRKTLRHHDYTIGWIAPMEVEMTAALEMLDEEHTRLPQSSTDHNVYNLGSIAGHNIVVASLPAIGNYPAAVVATQMRMTFPNVKFGLLVGIGGGVPIQTGEGLVRLGDVVVNKPTSSHSGTVHYTYGREELLGSFMAPTPSLLLDAAEDLAARRAGMREDPILKNLSRIDTGIRGLQRYKWPGHKRDTLYKSDYLHKTRKVPCSQGGCDPNQTIKRKDARGSGELSVVVHRGTIASTDRVVKDAAFRDRFAAKNRVICFEMEAAGSLADFPCIVIRGVSDYCDTHKNDDWHGFASATAAAYARQLCFHMSVEEVRRYVNRP